MEQRAHMPFWKIVKKAALIAFFSVLLALVLTGFLGKYILPLLSIDGDNLQYLKHYYDNVNKSQTKGRTQDRIVILNIEEFGDGLGVRKKIAQLIETVCEHDPLVVGVDILFSGEKEPEADSCLKAVVKKYADKIVLASGSPDGKNLLPNIFDNDPSLNFGLINLPEYTSFRPTMEVNGAEIPRFPYLISRIAQPDQEIDFDRFMVNYSPREFNAESAIWFLDGTDAEKDADVAGKIVLIGETENIKDYHQNPFKIGGSDWTQGIYLHAYALYSLLNPETDALHRMSWPANLAICYLMCFLFSIAFVVLFDWVDRKKQSSRFGYPCYLIAKPLLLIVANVAIWFICYLCFTRPFRYVPHVVLYMVSTFLINTFNDFITYTFKTK